MKRKWNQQTRRAFHDDMRDFQRQAISGNRVAFLKAVSNYLDWTRDLVPRHQAVGWLKLRFDQAIEEYESGKARTLDDAIGLPRRTKRRADAIRSKYDQCPYKFNPRRVRELIDAAAGKFNSDRESHLEDLGRQLLAERRGVAASSIKSGAASRAGARAYFLRPYHAGSRYAAAVGLRHDARNGQLPRKVLRRIYGVRRTEDAIGRMLEVSGSTVVKWELEVRKLEIYFKVTELIVDDRLPRNEALVRTAGRFGETEERARRWFDEGHRLFMESL